MDPHNDVEVLNLAVHAECSRSGSEVVNPETILTTRALVSAFPLRPDTLVQPVVLHNLPYSPIVHKHTCSHATINAKSVKSGILIADFTPRFVPSSTSNDRFNSARSYHYPL